jgi:hypothetical protein
VGDTPYGVNYKRILEFKLFVVKPVRAVLLFDAARQAGETPALLATGFFAPSRKTLSTNCPFCYG